MEHKIESLPKWAQKLLMEKHRENAELVQSLANLKCAHAILLNREWFTIPGPTFEDSEDYRHLFILDREHPYAICSLGKNDVLLIGRNVKNEQPLF
jgi:hypothetical protein